VNALHQIITKKTDETITLFLSSLYQIS